MQKTKSDAVTAAKTTTHTRPLRKLLGNAGEVKALAAAGRRADVRAKRAYAETLTAALPGVRRCSDFAEICALLTYIAEHIGNEALNEAVATACAAGDAEHAAAHARAVITAETAEQRARCTSLETYFRTVLGDSACDAVGVEIDLACAAIIAAQTARAA
ncbi:MAG: hypothetical protein EPO40_17690 [Myxococcaceae bacterium]|nr:MAG: hypothetical protein EPO40_17690 [Myxococcaceae bacterium]